MSSGVPNVRGAAAGWRLCGGWVAVAHWFRGGADVAGTMDGILVPVSPGELLDRLSILGLKSERIAEAEKLAAIRREIAGLETARAMIPMDARVRDLVADLDAVNGRLWDAEEALRALDRAGDFGPGFLEHARSVYRLNDRRSALKRLLNDHLGAATPEVKSHGGS